MAAAILLALAPVHPEPLSAQTEGDYLYRVTTVRATPGQYRELIETLQSSFELAREAGDEAPFWFRHSQGDQWDFMLIYPMESFAAYHDADRTAQRERVWTGSRGVSVSTRIEEYIAFQEEWFATSVDLAEMSRRFDGMGLFHVEMFAGIPGKRGELLEQRRMENRFYQHLDRQLNLLFVRAAGTNWDAMTIGFYESLQAYAAAGAASTADEQEEAANRAGFDGVGDIGPYLRSLLSYHHDTLGVPVG